jgi:hypothetical protein
MSIQHKKVELEYSYLFNKSNPDKGITRDENIPNRYWLEYPVEWRTANIKEKIVGFRSFFINPSVRFIIFGFMVFVNNEYKRDYVISIVLNGNEDFSKFETEFKKQIKEDADNFILICAPTLNVPDFNVYRGKNWESFNLPMIGEEESDFNVDMLTDDTDVKKYSSFSVNIVAKYKEYKFIVTNLNKDTKLFLNCEDYEIDPETGDKEPQTQAYKGLLFHNVFDRASCLLKSNLVSSTMNNYLGYTNVRYDPMKYYKITNDDSKFYIDLYNGHNYSIISNLTSDNRDNISIELVMIR